MIWCKVVSRVGKKRRTYGGGDHGEKVTPLNTERDGDSNVPEDCVEDR